MLINEINDKALMLLIPISVCDFVLDFHYVCLFRAAVVSEVEALLSSSSLDPGSSVIALSAATIYSHLDNYEEALRVLNQHDTLEW